MRKMSQSIYFFKTSMLDRVTLGGSSEENACIDISGLSARVDFIPFANTAFSLEGASLEREGRISRVPREPRR